MSRYAKLYSSSSLSVLEQYVGKIYYMDFLEIKVEMVLGGVSGPPFFLCKWIYSDQVFCSEPYEVLCNFDDNLRPIKDFEM